MEPSSSSGPTTDISNEVAHIQKLRASIDERKARWSADRKIHESEIFEIQRKIRRLEAELKDLKEIAAAEAAEEAKKKSWATWFLSPLYKPIQESEAEVERKDRARQERLVEKSLKERRLESEQAEVRQKELHINARERAIAEADQRDGGRIAALYRAKYEKQEAERVAKARAARQKEAELREAEAAERAREYQKQMAEWLRQQEEKREREAREQRERQARQHSTRFNYGYSSYDGEVDEGRGGASSLCDHGGWWSKRQGRANCPVCFESWTYLLSCPGCQRLACPRCQNSLRPRGRRW